ncbi:hypothetical protein HK101_001769, partial [Irineochytrium annulatum]
MHARNSQWDALELARDHAATAIANLQFHLSANSASFQATTAPAIYSNASFANVATSAPEDLFRWNRGSIAGGRSSKVARTTTYNQQYADIITTSAPSASSYSFAFQQQAPINPVPLHHQPYSQHTATAPLYNFDVSLTIPELLLPKSRLSSEFYQQQLQQQPEQQQIPYAQFVGRTSSNSNSPPPSASAYAPALSQQRVSGVVAGAYNPGTFDATPQYNATRSPPLTVTSSPPLIVLSSVASNASSASTTTITQVVGSAPGAADVLRTRKRRSRIRASEKEVRCDCRMCGAPLGSLHLIGEPEDFERAFACDLLCLLCSSWETLKQPSGTDREADVAVGAAGLPAKVRRKRKRSERREVECKVCLEVVAYGGCRMLVANNQLATPVASPVSSPVDAANTEAWVEPEFKAEMFCKGCKDDFRFCSSCGGGSTTRSGKWRPKQLFHEGRKTCSLPHVRVGSATRFHTVNYRMIHSANQPVTLDPLLMLGSGMDAIPFSDIPPADAIPALTSAVADHAELHLMQIMDATVMRASTLATFEALSARTSAVREEVNRFMSGSYRPRFERMPRVSRRYLSVVYHPDVRPARRAQQESRDCRVGAASRGWTVGASIAFTWDVDARIVSCAFNSCKVQMSGRSDVLLQEMSLCLQRIREDAERESLPRPMHVNIAVSRGGRFHARADFVLRGCGFMPVGEYLGRMRGMVEERRREWEVVLGDVGVIDEESKADFETFVAECKPDGELLSI